MVLKDYPTSISNLPEFCLQIKPELMAIFPKKSADELSLDQIRKLLFVSRGWRLNNQGTKLLSEIYTHYKIVSNKQILPIMTGKILLSMDNICRMPWSIRENEVLLFDQMLHFELSLVDGDVEQFIKCKS